MKRHHKQANAITYYPPSDDGHRWIENASDGLRVRAVHDICRAERWRAVEHTGWYVDDFQDEIMHGAVIQLPARNGAPQYVCAVSNPCNDDCYHADFSYVETDLYAAVVNADSMAERAAEQEREFQRVESARCRVEEIGDELADNRADVRAILAERRTAPIESFPALRAAICARIVSLLEERTALFAERRKLYAEVSL